MKRDRMLAIEFSATVQLAAGASETLGSRVRHKPGRPRQWLKATP
jgi:hypothetical protein